MQQTVTWGWFLTIAAVFAIFFAHPRVADLIGFQYKVTPEAEMILAGKIVSSCYAKPFDVAKVEAAANDAIGKMQKFYEHASKGYNRYLSIAVCCGVAVFTIIGVFIFGRQEKVRGQLKKDNEALGKSLKDCRTRQMLLVDNLLREMVRDNFAAKSTEDLGVKEDAMEVSAKALVDIVRDLNTLV
jgi:hypothetical protein